MTIDFRTEPARYKHWKLSIDGNIATLAMDVDEQGGLVEGYELKLNSYDLGVDIELYDAIQRLRFCHPEVGAVVVTSAKERVFCSGANIYMLGGSTHSFKVNFCKFTNETRLYIEDASANSGLRFIAACKGTTAGGGYELALACDDIVLVDDGSSAVSFPETPLLAVLPGDGEQTAIVYDTGDLRIRKFESGTDRAAYAVDYNGHSVVIASCGAELEEAQLTEADQVLSCESVWPQTGPVFIFQDDPAG
mgnify:CR=1 FL=1